MNRLSLTCAFAGAIILASCGGSTRTAPGPYSPEPPKPTVGKAPSQTAPAAPKASEALCADVVHAFQPTVQSLLQDAPSWKEPALLGQLYAQSTSMRWVTREGLSASGALLLKLMAQSDAHGVDEKDIELSKVMTERDAYLKAVADAPATQIPCDEQKRQLQAAIQLELSLTDVALRVSRRLKYDHPGEALTHFREQLRRQAEAAQKNATPVAPTTEMQASAEPLTFEDKIKAWLVDWKNKSHALMLANIAKAASSESNAQQYWDDLIPRHPHYRRLLNEAQHYRTYEWTPLKPVRSLKLGSAHPDIKKLRARLQIEGYAAGEVDHAKVDAELLKAVQSYKLTHRLNPANPSMADFWKAINVPASVRYEAIRLNLRRLRTSAVRDAADVVLVNVPDFSLEVWRKGQVVQKKKIVVGRPKQTKCDEETQKTVYAYATPTFSAEIEKVIFAPYWNVPKDIKETEVDVKAASQENYLTENGYELVEENNFQYLRQLPSPGNALGFVKLIFPNKFGVYLHDTPEKQFFSMPRRAYSHGCMRLEEPLQTAKLVLEQDGQWDEAKMQSLYASWARGDGLNPENQLETVVMLNKPQLIVVEYLTAVADDEHHVHFIPDVYELDHPNPKLGRTCIPQSKAAVTEFRDVPAQVQSLMQRADNLRACYDTARPLANVSPQPGVPIDPRIRPSRNIVQFADSYRNLAASIQNRHDVLTAEAQSLDSRFKWTKKRTDEAVMIRRLLEGLQAGVGKTESLCQLLLTMTASVP